MTDGPLPVAVVLAGGTSRRFGSDKLGAALPSGTVLDTVLAGLDPEIDVIVVGPARPVVREVRFVREDPPGGGPAAALVAGLVAALAGPTAALLVLPGDAPGAGVGATLLRQRLVATGSEAMVATDGRGRWQPLQLALTPVGAARLVALAGSDRGRDASARALVERLAPQPYGLDDAARFDIDTRADLDAYLARQR